MAKVLLSVRPEEWLLLPFLVVLLVLHGGEGALGPGDVADRVARELTVEGGEFGLFWYFALWIFGGAFVLSVLLRTPLFRPLRDWWGRPVAEGESSLPKRVAEALFAGPAGAARRYEFVDTLKVALAAARGYAPFLVCFAIYSLLRDLVAELRPGVLYDAPLLALDRAVFGVDPFAWVRTRLDGPWFDGWIDAFCVASYSSYMYAAPLLACLLFALGDVRGFRHLMLSISLASFVGYLGYVLVPVVGPHVAFPDLYARTAGDGSALMVAMEAIRGDATRDCFPSLHTAWTVILLLAAWRYRRFVFWLYLPFGVGVMVAVFYFGKHYGADVLAGGILAAAAWRLARATDAGYDRLRERHGLAPLAA